MQAAAAWLGPVLGATAAENPWIPWVILGVETVAFIIILAQQQKSFQDTIDAQDERFAADIERAQEKSAELQKQVVQSRLAVQTQSELLATLSREVRSHMDGIVGSANLLLETKLQPSQRMQLVTLRATSESLLYVLGDVQAVCELETRTIRPVPAPLDLRTEFSQVIEVLAPRAALKNIELSLLIAPGVPRRVVADAGLLRQFLFNLSASALRLAETGALILHIDATTAEPSAAPDSIRIRFGASASKLAPGSGYRSHSRSPLGTEENMEHGMELAVTKRLVELMGGRFGVSGGRGDDADFWCELPLQTEPAGTPPPAAPPRLGCFAVIFDDLPSARLAAAGLLDEMQVEHELVSTAAEAIEALKLAVVDEPQTVLLLDESLPAEELTQLAEGLAAAPALQNVRVILLSMRPERVGGGLPIPVSAVLQKPLLQAREIQAAIESAQRAPAPGRPPEISVTATPFAPTTGPRVLLAEDDEISGQVITTMLKRLGCTATQAHDGLQAVALAEAGAFDVVLMDIRMPRLNGWDATKRIREKLGDKAPPVVAVSAEAATSDREKATQAGMADFIVKPVSKAELVRVLSRLAGLPPDQGSAAPM